MTDQASRGRRRRALVAIGLPAVVATTLLPLTTVLDNRLPDHVTLAGQRYALDWAGWALMVTGVCGLLAITAWLILLAHWRHAGMQRVTAAVMWSMTVWVLFYLSPTATTPAHGVPWWLTGAQLVAMAAAAAAGWLLAGPLPAAAPAYNRPDLSAPRLPLAAGERAMWRLPMFVPAHLVAAFALMATAGGAWWREGRFGWPQLIALVAAVFAMLLTSVRVLVDGSGVTVVHSPLLRIRTHVPFSEVGAAHVRRVSVWRDFKGAAFGWFDNGRTRGYVLRSGEALSLRLTEGREFVVTVDDAVTAAGLVNAELDRQRATAG